MQSNPDGSALVVSRLAGSKEDKGQGLRPDSVWEQDLAVG